jgi:hypothetical protein
VGERRLQRGLIQGGQGEAPLPIVPQRSGQAALARLYPGLSAAAARPVCRWKVAAASSAVL